MNGPHGLGYGSTRTVSTHFTADSPHITIRSYISSKPQTTYATSYGLIACKGILSLVSLDPTARGNLNHEPKFRLAMRTPQAPGFNRGLGR